MNVFYLDVEPKVAARFMIDKHVNKMIVESAQLLANCYDLTKLASVDCPKTQKGTDRKYSYYNHPCAIWTRKSYSNFQWVLDHAIYLIEERKFRFDKDHFCRGFLDWCSENNPNIDDVGLTTPAQAFKKGVYDYLVDLDNPVQAYRNYYCADKKYDSKGRWMVRYTNRNIPLFWREVLTKEELQRCEE